MESEEVGAETSGRIDKKLQLGLIRAPVSYLGNYDILLCIEETKKMSPNDFQH